MADNSSMYFRDGIPRRYVTAVTVGAVVFSALLSMLIGVEPLVGAALLFSAVFPLIYRFRKAFIMFYSVYLPFEELFLKYVPDQLYPFFRYGGEVIIFLLFVAVVALNLLKGKVWRRTQLDTPILLLVGAVAASMLVNSVPPVVAALGVKNLFRYIFLFFMITQSNFSRKDVRIFIGIFLVTGFFQVLTGVLQMVAADYVYDFFTPKDIIVSGKLLRSQVLTLDEHGFRISGTLVRYGIYGNYIGMFMCMLFARRYILKDTGAVNTALLFLGMFVLVASFSRKGWLALYLAYIYMNMLSKRKLKVAVLVGAPLVIVPVLVAYYGFSNSITGASNPVERLVMMFSPVYLSHALERTRLYILTYVAFRIGLDYFWFGFGPGLIGSGVTGTAGGTSALFAVDKVSSLDFFDERLQLLTDVGFVNIFAQMGFFGILAFLLIFKRLFFYGKVLLHSADKNIRVLAFMFMGFLVIMIVENLLGSAFTYRAVSFYFWLFAGLLVSSIHLPFAVKDETAYR